MYRRILILTVGEWFINIAIMLNEKPPCEIFLKNFTFINVVMITNTKKLRNNFSFCYPTIR